MPLDLILLLDTSSSMRDRMPVVHDAARGFMKILRPEDRGAVVAFSDHVRVLQDLTSDAGAIEDAINSTMARGATALHNAIYVALKEFGRTAQSAGEVRRQAIAVLSDGEDTSSLLSFDDVVTLARKTGVNIYTISLQSQFTSLRQTQQHAYFSNAGYTMKALAKETGARSFFPASIHELRDVYRSIADELESQYLHRLLPVERPSGRTVPPHRRPRDRGSVVPPARPRRLHGRRARDDRRHGASAPLTVRPPRLLPPRGNVRLMKGCPPDLRSS